MRQSRRTLQLAGIVTSEAGWHRGLMQGGLLSVSRAHILSIDMWATLNGCCRDPDALSLE